MVSRKGFIMSGAALVATSLLFFSMVVSGSPVLAQEAGQKTFATPQEAGNALNESVESGDKAAQLAVLGASAASVITSGDDVQDKNNADIFLKHYKQMNRWARESNGTETLYVGAENWPFPIALTKNKAGQWYFDTKSGLQEILFRRIGKNELSTIEVCNALVDGQLEYFRGAARWQHRAPVCAEVHQRRRQAERPVLEGSRGTNRKARSVRWWRTPMRRATASPTHPSRSTAITIEC